MAGILAIESDRKRQNLLTALVGQHVQAELTIVDSARAAIASFAENTPDLILVPTLLSPRESDDLIAHVKSLPAAHVQMLTVPALDILMEPPQVESHGRGLFRRRQPVSLGLQYDPGIVGVEIADRLERALTLRAEHEWAARAKGDNVSTALALCQIPKTAGVVVGEVKAAAPPDRRCARRTQPGGAASWSVRLPWGTDVELVNISCTGLLVESGAKLTPGVALELQLTGPEVNRIVLARFVRTEIARVDRLGVRYHAAAHFEKPLDVLAARNEPAEESIAHSLADLVRTVLTTPGPQREPSSSRFARGLRSLLGARDVLIRQAPIAPIDDSESIFFHVSGDGASRRILQVMFERDRALTAAEFSVLKAAASFAAAVLELERPVPADESRPALMSEVA